MAVVKYSVMVDGAQQLETEDKAKAVEAYNKVKSEKTFKDNVKLMATREISAAIHGVVETKRMRGTGKPRKAKAAPGAPAPVKK